MNCLICGAFFNILHRVIISKSEILQLDSQIILNNLKKITLKAQWDNNSALSYTEKSHQTYWEAHLLQRPYTKLTSTQDSFFKIPAKYRRQMLQIRQNYNVVRSKKCLITTYFRIERKPRPEINFILKEYC